MPLKKNKEFFIKTDKDFTPEPPPDDGDFLKLGWKIMKDQFPFLELLEPEFKLQVQELMALMLYPNRVCTKKKEHNYKYEYLTKNRLKLIELIKEPIKGRELKDDRILALLFALFAFSPIYEDFMDA